METRGRRRRFGSATVALMAVLATVSLAGCSRSDPEQALRDTLADLQAAVEAREASAVAAHLADDFIGPGSLDRDGARRLAALHFLRHRQVGVHTPGPLTLSLQDGHARVAFTAAVTGGERVLPDAAQVYRIDSGWRLEGDTWRMTSIEWTPAMR